MAVRGIELQTHLSKNIYTYLVLAHSEVRALEKVLMEMLVCSVQIISRLDSQSKFQMLTLFSGHNVGVPRRYINKITSTWRLHTGLCKFVQNTTERNDRSHLNFGLAHVTIWSAQIGHMISFFWRAEQLRFEMNAYGRTLHHGKSIEKDMRSLIIDDILSGGGGVSTEYYPGSFRAIGSKYRVRMEDLLSNGEILHRKGSTEKAGEVKNVPHL